MFISHQPTGQSVSCTNGNAPHVLVVAEDDIVSADISRRLTEFGCRVGGPARSGEEALDLLSTSTADIVVMDVRLGESPPGTAAARLIHDRFQTPVVYLATCSDSASFAHVSGTNDCGIVAQPAGATELNAALLLALATHSRACLRQKREREQQEQVEQRLQEQAEMFSELVVRNLEAPVHSSSALAAMLASRADLKLSRFERDLLDRLRQRLEGVTDVVDDLRNFTRAAQRAGARGLHSSAGAALNRALNSLSEAVLSSDAEILSDPLPTVRCDPAQLTEIFQQLIANSLRFRRRGIRPVIRISVETLGSEWLFVVSDNGAGFSDAYRETIFEPFQRLHPHTHPLATGLGLSLCRKIVESLRGRIWAEGQEGSGATFRFTLPCARQ